MLRARLTRHPSISVQTLSLHRRILGKPRLNGHAVLLSQQLVMELDVVVAVILARRPLHSALTLSPH